MTEQVNHPSHYNQNLISIETIEIIDLLTNRPAFDLGNAIKYICRAPYKGTPLVDLEKALWYINDYTLHAHNKTGVTISAFEKNQLLKVGFSMRDCEESSIAERSSADILKTLIFDLTEYAGRVGRTQVCIKENIALLRAQTGDKNENLDKE